MEKGRWQIMIKFYKNRYKFFAVSLILIVLGFVFLGINGMDLSIQFKGGAILKYTYQNEINTEQVAEVVNQTLNRSADVQLTTDLATNSQKVVISLAGTEGVSAQDQEALDNALKAAFPSNDLNLSESNIVQAFIGKKFLQNSMIALILSSILIVVYVAIRFQKISGLSAGVMALVALFHDVAIVFFTFIVFKLPINESFIAVALTIIGYSINDTIVIYDRIRENNLLSRKMALSDLVDKSITQSLSRSLNTSLTTVISITIVYIFASVYNIESIKVFALPMMIGLISGTYSTIFIAGPLWVMWQNHKTKSKGSQGKKQAKA